MYVTEAVRALTSDVVNCPHAGEVAEWPNAAVC